MIERLKAMKKNIEEIDKLLIDGQLEIAAMTKLSKERSDLEPAVLLFDKLTKIENDKKDAENLLKDEDSEIREMTINESAEKIEQLRNKIKIELLPKDANDDKNIIMKIRDEANIFDGELFIMYSHYVDKKEWKLQILNSDPTLLRGYSLVSFRILGRGVYSKLKFESGTHCIQRVPVTEGEFKHLLLQFQ